jgi:hypothetical protein
VSVEQKRSIGAWPAPIAAALVVVLFLSYYYSVARKTDISFDGAIFLQPIVSLERIGVLTHTYSTRSPSDFHLPLTNLGQGMLSQSILNWPFVHLFGINHVTLQAANLIFLLLGGVLMYLLVGRLTGNRVLSLAGALLFYTTPNMKALGLQGFGEVPGAFYLLACAFLLHVALSRPRCFWWLGFVAFLAYHTKNYLILVYPMILILLGYLWLRQKTVRFRDLLRFSIAFWAGMLSLPLIFILKYGWHPFVQEMSAFWGLIASTQWGVSLGREERDPQLIRQAVRVLSNNYGGWRLFYLPIATGHLMTMFALAVKAKEPAAQSDQSAGESRVISWAPAFDATQVVLLFLLGLSLFYIGYWFHFSTWAIWYRRVFPFLIIQIPLWLIALERVWTLGKNRVLLRTVAALGVAGLLLLAGAHTKYFVLAYDRPLPDELALKERIEATDVIRSMPAEARLFGLGWWQAPRLSLFSGRIFLDLTTTGDEYNEGYLVLDRETLGVAAEGVARRLSSMETKTIWENRSNRIIAWKRRRIDLSRIRVDPGLKLLRIGPDHSTTAGERFSAQPGGTFAMWAATEGATPKTLLLWNGVLLHSSVRPDGKLMTAMVPKAFFSLPGCYPIGLYDPENQRRSDSLVMTIR